MNKYSIKVRLTTVLERFIEIEADNEENACYAAEEQAGGTRWVTDPTLMDGVEECGESITAEVDELIEGEEPENEKS